MADTTIRRSDGANLVPQKAIDLGDDTYALAVGVQAGSVGGYTAVARTTITRPADTTQYAAGDAWSDSTSAPTVPSITAARVAAGTGLLMALALALSANQSTKPEFTVYVLRAAPTALEDNSAVDLSDAEARNIVAIFSVTEDDWQVVNAAAGASGGLVAQVAPVYAAGFDCESGSQALHLVVVVDNAYTPTSAEVLALAFTVSQD